MRIAFCQLPDNLATTTTPQWNDFTYKVAQENPEVLVLNEMPFGSWLARSEVYDSTQATVSVIDHSIGIRHAQSTLPVPAILTSRPVLGSRKLENHAVLLRNGECIPVHQKQYFPEEDTYFEKTWFTNSEKSFSIVNHGPLRIGFLLCTELMFTEWARLYRRLGANLIVAPRTSGMSTHYWHTAAAMAAIVSGCYVVSSNRCSQEGKPGPFGGGGFVFSPAGVLMKMTSELQPVASVDIDLDAVKLAQRSYPCYISEL